MNYYIIPAALIITLLITLLFSVVSKRSMRSFAVFFLIVFLATLAGQLWITPFGPVTWGIAWFPLLVVSLFFSFLIIALIPPVGSPPKTLANNHRGISSVTLGMFFWIILILLILAVIIGYYKFTLK